MQEKLNDVVSGLGVAEKTIIEENYLEKMRLWARLIDEVEAGLPQISDISNATSNFEQTKRAYEQLLQYVKVMNASQNTDSLSLVKNYYSNFNQYLNQLIELKQKIRTLTEDFTDVAALKKVVADAKKQQIAFEKSFKKSLEKQARGSQRALATHFKKRLEEVKASDETNPKKWLEKRNWWFIALLSVIVVFAVSFLFIYHNQWLKGYELQLTLVKFAIVAILYLQYHFSAKNYHIYADLVAKYEHLAVISETMTDFTAAAYDNNELNTVVYTNAAKTLFSDVNTGHLKQVTQEPSVIENFINQIPKGGQ